MWQFSILRCFEGREVTKTYLTDNTKLAKQLEFLYLIPS